MMLSRNRYGAALVLLMLMVANFATEGYSLYRAHGGRLLAMAGKVETSACSGHSKASNTPDTEASETGSCCSKKKAAPKDKPCGCPHCGDHCPMGDACTCTQSLDEKPVRSEGFFFRAPGCHPEQDLNGHYLPLSMRVIFVTTSAAAPLQIQPAVADSSEPHPMLAGPSLSPPVPPPQCAAA